MAQDKPTEKTTPTSRKLHSVLFNQPMNIFGMMTGRIAADMANLASLRWDGEKVIATSHHDVHSGQEVWILPAAIAQLGWK